MKIKSYIPILMVLLVACSKPAPIPAAPSPQSYTSPLKGSKLVKKSVERALPKEVFDLCYFDPQSASKDVANGIIKLINLSNKKTLFLVIGSENSAKNREVATLVLSHFSPNQLIGSKIALVGTKGDQAVLEALVKLTGAQFIFVELIDSVL